MTSVPTPGGFPDGLREQWTGLPSRELLLDRLTHAAERARRHADFRFGVLAVAIDQFRMIGDSYGPDIAGAVLLEAAWRIRACIRTEDTATLWSGGDFVVLLESIVDERDGLRVAERIQRRLARPFMIGGRELRCSAGAGIVLSSTAPAKASRLVQEAGIALSRARASAPGALVMYDGAMHARVLERLQIETDLRRAVERREFEVYYQPQVTLANGRITEVEALVRWHHPTRGLVAPLDFIPLAEETGVISAIGRFVLEQACRQTTDWQRRIDRDDAAPLSVSVNLSLKQTITPDFTAVVEEVVRRSGLDAASVRLEITESFAIDDAERTARLIRDLRVLGIGVYLDDFGTGYSNLDHLHRLSLDGLKIDRSFVMQMHDGPTQEQIVRTVRDLARNIGVPAIAEGVESHQQLDALRALGCEAAQGYLFSRPVPASEMERLLAAGTRW